MKHLKQQQALRSILIFLLPLLLLIYGQNYANASVGKPLESQWLHNFYAAAKELDQKLYKDAHRDLLKCLDQVGNDPVKALTTISLLERLYEETGDFDAKEKVLQTHLQVLKGLGFPDDAYAQVYVELAEIYGAQERFQKAQHYLNLALPILRRTTGEFSVDVGVTLNNLAFAELKLGKYEAAETHYKKSLETFQKCEGVKSLFYAFTASNLGDFYAHFDKQKLAEQFFKLSLEAFEYSLGPAHPLSVETKERLERLRKFPQSKPETNPKPARPQKLKKTSPLQQEKEKFPDFAFRFS